MAVKRIGVGLVPSVAFCSFILIGRIGWVSEAVGRNSTKTAVIRASRTGRGGPCLQAV